MSAYFNIELKMMQGKKKKLERIVFRLYLIQYIGIGSNDLDENSHADSI